jgi:hypothetical protein
MTHVSVLRLATLPVRNFLHYVWPCSFGAMPVIKPPQILFEAYVYVKLRFYPAIKDLDERSL